MTTITSTRFLVPAAQLRAALTRLKPAVPNRARIPVLAFVRLTAGRDGLTITATDLDLTITVRVPLLSPHFGTASEPISALIPFKSTLDSLPTRKADLGGNVEILCDSEAVTVSYRGRVSALPTGNIEDFPYDPHVDVAAAQDHSLLDLGALASVAPAMSTDQARPVLYGVLLDGTSMVATDSYRLHLVEDTTTKVAGQIILPLPLVKAVLAGKPTTARLAIGEGRHTKQVTVRTNDGTVLTACVVDGTFPSYKPLIPTSLPDRIIFDGPALESVLTEFNRMKPSPGVPVRLSGTNRELTLRMIEVDRYDVIRTVRGSFPFDQVVGFAPKYLADLLVGGFGSIAVKDPLRPAVVSRQDGKQVTTRLLMPVRIG